MTAHCPTEGRFTGHLPGLHGMGSPLAVAPLAPALLASGYLVIPSIPAGPWWTGALRVAIAGVILVGHRPGLPRGAWWWRSTVAGTATLGGTFVLQAAAVHRLGAPLAASLVASTVMINTIRAVLAHEEPRVTLAVTAAAVAGLSLALQAAPHQANTWDLIGMLAALAAAGCLALGKELTRRWGRPTGVHPITVTGWQLTAGALVLLPTAFLLEGPPPAFDAAQWWRMAWLAAGATAAAYAIQLGGLLGGINTAVVSRLAMLTPVATTALTWWIAQRRPGPLEIAGLAVTTAAITTGVLLATRYQPRPPRTPGWRRPSTPASAHTSTQLARLPRPSR